MLLLQDSDTGIREGCPRAAGTMRSWSHLRTGHPKISLRRWQICCWILFQAGVATQQALSAALYNSSRVLSFSEGSKDLYHSSTCTMHRHISIHLGHANNAGYSHSCCFMTHVKPAGSVSASHCKRRPYIIIVQCTTCIVYVGTH